MTRGSTAVRSLQSIGVTSNALFTSSMKLREQDTQRSISLFSRPAIGAVAKGKNRVNRSAAVCRKPWPPDKGDDLSGCGPNRT